ncbi:MAG TPA: FAD-dependent oxidoreductase, partial [Geminicoccaceae bacterium]|nr:FAD-dependent oxidoreductase [Geminicoccaceae bacterium]
MKVLVLGGGVIGVTTAWFLARDGHEVTLVEREQGVA